LLRCRGGEPASWIVEACDAQGRLRLAAGVAGRKAPASSRRAAG
jgi:protein ImuA